MQSPTEGNDDFFDILENFCDKDGAEFNPDLSTWDDGYPVDSFPITEAINCQHIQPDGILADLDDDAPGMPRPVFNGPTDTSSEGGDDSSSAAQSLPAAPERRKRPRPSPDDEDARLIALETESHLRKLNLDPDSKEGKVERRKIQNRMSAQMHRERKRAYIETLETEVASRDATITRLRLRVLLLEDTLRAAGVPPPPVPEADSELGATSDSASDTGYSSAASSLFDRERGASITGSSLGTSLFSLLFLLSFGFTVMTKPDALGSFLSSSSFDGFASAGGPLLSHGAWAGHGRVLLADGPNDALSLSFDDDDNLGSAGAAFGQPVGPPVPVQARSTPPVEVVSAAVYNSSLWNFEGPAVHLYPGGSRPTAAERAKARADDKDYSVSGALVPTFPPVRHLQETSQSSLRGNAHATHRHRSEDKHALVPSFEPFPSAHGVGGERDDLFPSKILMTQGKALLDPSLVQTATVVHRRAFGFSNPTDEVIQVNNVNGDKKPDPRAGTALVAPAVFGRGAAPLSHDPSAVNSALGTSSAPQFLMMLPVESVKWGTSWDDDDSLSNPLTLLLKALQDNSSSVSGPEDTSSYWIEIGCSVLKAQLVKNVTLS